jgi:hypothetical protein
MCHGEPVFDLSTTELPLGPDVEASKHLAMDWLQLQYSLSMPESSSITFIRRLLLQEVHLNCHEQRGMLEA